jgi:hypothetical protein
MFSHIMCPRWTDFSLYLGPVFVIVLNTGFAPQAHVNTDRDMCRARRRMLRYRSMELL